MNAPARPAGADPSPEPFRAPAHGVHEAIADALATLHEPDLSGFGPAAVDTAITEMYGDHPTLRPAYRDWLYQHVSDASFGLTRMSPAGPGDAAVRSKDFTSTYHRLTGLFTERIVILQRARPQISLVAPKETR
ncbi:hypothetical protein Q0Z83_023070 [Actinoplanes sichuanensis]|uniref:Uncharacterized protein n=1 Tax=Actinoplanes sichuanensis TaxID=512349 RepID=A0ABW4A2H1_9ACTN|nr:hypothetical protein [Actinoplanes sichuanensis]BEL04116.1 hypothetical protein Q0Z83_023070 [Actinoplanes sichuanensis]